MAKLLHVFKENFDSNESNTSAQETNNSVPDINQEEMNKDLENMLAVDNLDADVGTIESYICDMQDIEEVITEVKDVIAQQKINLKEMKKAVDLDQDEAPEGEESNSGDSQSQDGGEESSSGDDSSTGGDSSDAGDAGDGGEAEPASDDGSSESGEGEEKPSDEENNGSEDGGEESKDENAESGDEKEPTLDEHASEEETKEEITKENLQLEKSISKLGYKNIVDFYSDLGVTVESKSTRSPYRLYKSNSEGFMSVLSKLTKAAIDGIKKIIKAILDFLRKFFNNAKNYNLIIRRNIESFELIKDFSGDDLDKLNDVNYSNSIYRFNSSDFVYDDEAILEAIEGSYLLNKVDLNNVKDIPMKVRAFDNLKEDIMLTVQTDLAARIRDDIKDKTFDGKQIKFVTRNSYYMTSIIKSKVSFVKPTVLYPEDIESYKEVIGRELFMGDVHKRMAPIIKSYLTVCNNYEKNGCIYKKCENLISKLDKNVDILSSIDVTGDEELHSFVSAYISSYRELLDIIKCIALRPKQIHDAMMAVMERKA